MLPTLLCESDADRRLHARFAEVAREVSEDIWNGSTLEAIDKFIAFWNGSGPQDPLPASARLRMIERADKLAFDFTAAFAEENVATAAASLRVPTLLLSGGLSPYLTQRIVQRLGAIMDWRRDPAFAGRRPYAAADACVIRQSRDRAAYRPRGRTRRRSAGARSGAGGGRQPGGGVTFLALGCEARFLVSETLNLRGNCR